jgi:hypothetical protein
MIRRRIATVAYIALAVLFLLVVWSEFNRVRGNRAADRAYPPAEAGTLGHACSPQTPHAHACA